MKKRFVLSVIAVTVVGIGCSGCGLSGGGEIESAVDVDISNEEVINSSETETLTTKDVTVEAVSGIEESAVQEVQVETTESTGEEAETQEDKESEVTESLEVSASPEVSEETGTEETPEATTEEEAFVAYDPNYVVSLATEKTKAYGKILVWENLDRLLAEGSITQEEYEEYYPYDGLENSYYSVFVETDLSKASTTSGRMLVSEEEIADYIAEMLALETGPYFAISYAGIYKGTSGDFYEFRCHR